MNEILNNASVSLTEACIKIVGALLVYLIGRFLIKKLVNVFKNLKAVAGLDPTAANFAVNAVKAVLYVLLIVSVIGILGVPMASVAAVLASAGVTVGMALQGSLSNLAGGIMLMIFKPYKLGDFVETTGESGTVKDISTFYTTLLTADNRKVMIPNGSIMNANIKNYSSEETRRVDLEFSVARGEDIGKIQETVLKAFENDGILLKDPAPIVPVTGGNETSMQFSPKVWCNSADYWGAYFAANKDIAEALKEAGINAPVIQYRETK